MIYCYPQVEARTYFPLAKRFADSWKAHDPGAIHSLVIGCNGVPPRPMDMAPFAGLNYSLAVHNNYGWDIGLYLMQSYIRTEDLLVCLGAGTIIDHPGWLRRLLDAVVEHGPGLYGPYAAKYPNPHVRTTAFACPPALLRGYTRPVTSERRSRYAFEHGQYNFTRFTLDSGFPAVMVTWKGSFPYPHWTDDTMPQGSEALLRDKQHA